MRQTIFCNHYRSMSDHKDCAAGVLYETLKGIPFEKRPCFARNGKPAPPGCDLAQFPTKEEIAAEEAEFKKLFERTVTARNAIVEHLGPYTEDSKSASGAINCPVCGGDKSLRFRRAGLNGHIHAACTTEGCVRWME